MAITNNILIATAPTVVFTATGEQAITTMIFCNTDLTTPDIVTVWIVPAGQPLDTSRMVINQVSIPAGETFALDSERFVLENGDTIQAQSGQNSLISVCISSMATH
jgi:hypothetical protein